MKISFIGLGTMGYLIAGHIQRAGNDVTVFNRNSFISQKWVEEYGGSFSDSPAKAVLGSDIVIACVSDDNAVRDVTLGSNGAFLSMSPGSIYVDHTTASSDIAQELNAYASEHGFYYLDAPVSGGKPGATKGTLTVMVGGDENAFDKAMSILKAYLILLI